MRAIAISLMLLALICCQDKPTEPTWIITVQNSSCNWVWLRWSNEPAYGIGPDGIQWIEDIRSGSYNWSADLQSADTVITKAGQIYISNSKYCRIACPDTITWTDN